MTTISADYLSRCSTANSTVNGNVGTLDADGCTVNGDVDMVKGSRCTINGDVRELRGSHCSVNGDVYRVTGSNNSITGKVKYDTGRGNTREQTNVGGVVIDTGNQVVGVAHGPLVMTSSSRSSGPTGRLVSVSPAGAIVTQRTGSDGVTRTTVAHTAASAKSGGARPASSLASTTVSGSGLSVVNNVFSASGNAVITGGNIVSGAAASRPGLAVVNTFADGGRTVSIGGCSSIVVGPGRRTVTVPVGIASQSGSVHNIFVGGSRPAVVTSSSSGARRQPAPDLRMMERLRDLDREIQRRRLEELAPERVEERRRYREYMAKMEADETVAPTRKRGASASPPPAKRVAPPVPAAIDDEPAAEPGENVCVACHERAAKTINRARGPVACNHICLCVTCARTLADQIKMVCPVCRAELECIERVYMQGACVPLEPPATPSLANLPQ